MKFNGLKSLALLLLCLVALVVSSSCATKANDADDRSKVRVGIVFDIGGKDDRSFNARSNRARLWHASGAMSKRRAAMRACATLPGVCFRLRPCARLR